MSAYDVVLFGPTGVTGREVARYLAARAPELGMRWAVAGRDTDRMRDVLDRVGATPDAVLVADVDDAASIEAMVESTTVVANLVGPYARFGEAVYAACAHAGTHQLDLTGEIDWVAGMIAAYDEVATDRGARIVPTAGFEGLPFDLGALYAAHLLHGRTGDPVVSVDAAMVTTASPSLGGLADSVSGGTFQSMIAALRRGLNGGMKDPYCLDPDASTAAGRHDLRPRKHPVAGHWVGPMQPSAYINPPVIHRSAALLRDSGDPMFAPDFAYREGMSTTGLAPGPAAIPAAVVLSMTAAGFAGIGSLPDALRLPIADFLARVGLQPGDGPRPEDLDRWSYRIDVRATDARGATQDVSVNAHGHPGYKSTATMVGEAALALAGSDVPDGAGFLTPATALGLESLDRFSAAGVEFVAH